MPEGTEMNKAIHTKETKRRCQTEVKTVKDEDKQTDEDLRHMCGADRILSLEPVIVSKFKLESCFWKK